MRWVHMLEFGLFKSVPLHRVEASGLQEIKLDINSTILLSKPSATFSYHD